MIVQTFKGEEFYVDNETAAKIWAAKESKQPINLTRLGLGYMDPNAIARIKNGGEPPVDKRHRIAATTPMTREQVEEKMKHRREQIAKLKKEFLERHSSKA